MQADELDKPADATGLVRHTCNTVAQEASHVSISEEGLCHAASYFTSETLAHIVNLPYDKDIHFVDGGPLTAQYLLVLDALNFCFWPDGELEYEHIAKGLKASVQNDPSCITATKISSIDGPGLRSLVRWHRPLPLEEERARLLREVGCGLAAHFGGQAEQLVKAADGSATRLVELVVSHFPGFRDHTVYRGRQVFLYKRAQIWVGDIWGAFGGQGLGSFCDIGSLTMFADYRVPVTLRELGILKYSDSLEAKIEGGEQIPSGSEEEVEIRACTVVAVERLKAALEKKLQGPAVPVGVNGGCLHSILLDWWLWEEGEKKRSEQKHHKTLTVYY